MDLFRLLTFAIFAFTQAPAMPRFADEVLNAAEKARMAAAINIEQRINIYTAASKRIQQTLQAAVVADDFSKVPDSLELWDALLSGSLEDIEANLKSKKKSKALINYEIQVRKSLAESQEYKTKAPVDQQEMFDSCLSKAEKIRKRFVEIIFQR